MTFERVKPKPFRYRVFRELEMRPSLNKTPPPPKKTQKKQKN